ncbi:hypothetical protein QUF51_16915 [Bacillus pumilus]|nr:hypothetical protein [Bacillus pumilus]
MGRLKNWLSVWFGFMMNVLVNPGVMMKQQGCEWMVAEPGFFRAMKEWEQEKLTEEKVKKRKASTRDDQCLMMLYEKTMREARAGPVLPLQKS